MVAALLVWQIEKLDFCWVSTLKNTFCPILKKPQGSK